MKKIATILVLASGLAAAPAFAQQPMPSWYVGFGLGVGNLGMSGQDLTGLSNAQIDDSDTTYTVRGGYRFHPNFAVELGYYDLGTYAFSNNDGVVPVTGSAKAKSYGVSLVGIAPMGQFDLYGRLGWEESDQGQAIRRRNEPHFALKSLWLIFGFQAVLAWVISLPLAGAVASAAPLGPLDGLGVALWAVGLYFEAVGDWQLARFKSDPANTGKVMDRGLWRYTRHPNYFGDFSAWWGLYLLALSAGAWWSIVGPLIMSFLLLRFSGVRLLERDIGERRPAYVEYVRRTNAFFPGPRRESR